MIGENVGKYDPESSLADIAVLRLDGALRREREAHNQTKRERDEAQKELSSIDQGEAQPPATKL